MIIEPNTNPIRDVRIKYGLTQHKIAELTGIPFRTIQNWEGGQRKCPDYVVDMVVDKLDRLLGDKAVCPVCGTKLDK